MKVMKSSHQEKLYISYKTVATAQNILVISPLKPTRRPLMKLIITSGYLKIRILLPKEKDLILISSFNVTFSL